METTLKLNTEYKVWLAEVKTRIRQSQIKAALSVNSQMIMLYWEIGRQIVEKQEKAQWGSRLIEQLSKDLNDEFPDIKGFSRANLFRIKKFYQFYIPMEQQVEFVAQPLRQLQLPPWILIPWGHNVSIIEQVKEIHQALFYIHKTIENNWSRAVLEYHMANPTVRTTLKNLGVGACIRSIRFISSTSTV